MQCPLCGKVVDAAVVFAIWLTAQLLLCAPLARAVPGPVEGYFHDGPPRWKCILNMLTQLLVLPPLLACSLTAYGGSFDRWSRSLMKSSLRGMKSSLQGGVCIEWVFICIFPTWLLLDFVLVEVRVLMFLHHVVCLFGHYLACFAFPRGFPWYFVGVVALELGSCFCNIFSLWPTSKLAQWVYLVGMSISNMVALECMRRWRHGAHPIAAWGIVVAVITGVLVAGRQRETYRASYTW